MKTNLSLIDDNIDYFETTEKNESNEEPEKNENSNESNEKTEKNDGSGENQEEERSIKIKKLQVMNESIKKGDYKKILSEKDIFKKKLEKRSVSTVLIKHEEDRKSQFLIPLTDRTTIQSKDKNFRTQQRFVKINKIKKSNSSILFLSLFRIY